MFGGSHQMSPTPSGGRLGETKLDPKHPPQVITESLSLLFIIEFGPEGFEEVSGHPIDRESMESQLRELSQVDKDSVLERMLVGVFAYGLPEHPVWGGAFLWKIRHK
jgi:hypothetical protein